MIEATSIDHVNMMVKNLAKSIEFYDQVFGFTIRKDQTEDNSKIVGNDRIKLCLYEDANMSPDGGISHFGFAVENFDEIVANCEKLKVPILYGGAISWEHSRSIYIEDPSGYVIELSEIAGGGL